MTNLSPQEDSVSSILGTALILGFVGYVIGGLPLGVGLIVAVLIVGGLTSLKSKHGEDTKSPQPGNSPRMAGKSH
jgi:hypothetical protein